MVGTRENTSYGRKMATEISEDLAAFGITIVSGAARGIDTISHKGALRYGRTVAVLGCGINFNYLISNKNLRENVAKNGAVVSEYTPDYRVAQWTFPMRNRIISGLSDGTLVVEAAINSGTCVTARITKQEGKEVFFVFPAKISAAVLSPPTTELSGTSRPSFLERKGSEKVSIQNHFAGF